ncbi:MAG: cation-translocating P-type ATPase [Clostridiales bacterium]|nr:cation-translocating P-type ATPase [Clostridiales bacterium]
MREDYRPYIENAESVFAETGSQAGGLTSAEAASRLESDGPNKLIEAKKRSSILRFFDQMKDPMIIILLVAALLSLVTSLYEGESPADVFIILFVVVLNSLLGVIQENKAEEAIEALKQMTAAKSKVLRDGQIVSLESSELVVGDVVILEAGDSVPADGRIIEEASMKVEEAALTGESVPVTKQADAIELGKDAKDVPLGDRTNMVYMGSTVVYGRGRVLVTGTGMSTEMGKIADAISQAEEELTPLQIKLAQLSRILTKLVIGICLFIFALGVVRAGHLSMDVMIDTFMLAISLAVAAIPEGLVAVVTIVLSIGVTKMSQRNAVIRRLTAVETLGCAQIICSDKTGTLTQNKMTVVDYAGQDQDIIAAGMALCCDAELKITDKGEEVVGEPTEAALVAYSSSQKLPKTELVKCFPRVGEAPFDSGRKMMSTVHKNVEMDAPADIGTELDRMIAEAPFVQFTKGAPDVVLRHCTHILTDHGVEPLTDELAANVKRENSRMAGKALRVLSLAVRVYSEKPSDFSSDSLEKDLVFAGLVGMIDPIRPEVKDAVAECRTAGIRPIMITGDQLDTAIAIGRDLGIIESADDAILGSALDDMSDEELLNKVGTYSVYARVQPEHKVRIVKAWRARNMVTAMTGDGVNDAPAIKTADIGVGMGITGTDVTKNVADMILADDNFATIVAAVEEGRRIYANIRKCIQFLLATNISEVLSILTATILGFTILKPAHLLWINLITDSLPALALGMEDAEGDSMKEKPRSAREGVFAGGMDKDIIYQGAVTTLLVLTAYFVGEFLETGQWHITASNDGITMAFLTMSMCEIFHSFNMRSRRKSLFALPTHNKWLWGSAAVALLLTSTVIEIPALARLFGFTTISIKEYAVAMGLAILIIPIVEIIKIFQRSAESKRTAAEEESERRAKKRDQ